MKKFILLLAGLLVASQAHAQGYYVERSDRPHPPRFTVSGGINVQYWNDPDPQLKNIIRPRPQLGISYTLQLSKYLSIDPELIIRDNAIVISIAEGSFIDGRVQQYSTTGKYSGISGQMGLPLTLRYKWFGMSAGVFFERPSGMVYQITNYSVTSPTRTTSQRDVANLIGAGWQASVEASRRRYQVRATLNQRNGLILLRDRVLPNSTVIAVTLGYKI